MLGVVDYGAGNIHSILKAIEAGGIPARLIDSKEAISEVTGIVLPGVGAFRSCVDGLKARGLYEAIGAAIKSGKPFLGICIGMQMLFESSSENGQTQGMGLLKGRVERFPVGHKIPHMGWNSLIIENHDPLFAGIASGEQFYFVHSYRVQDADPGSVIAWCEYGENFPAAVKLGEHAYGVQFHPEKSGKNGLRLLKNFWDVISCS